MNVFRSVTKGLVFRLAVSFLASAILTATVAASAASKPWPACASACTGRGPGGTDNGHSCTGSINPTTRQCEGDSTCWNDCLYFCMDGTKTPDSSSQQIIDCDNCCGNYNCGQGGTYTYCN